MISFKDAMEFLEKHSSKMEFVLNYIAKSIWTRLATLIIFYSALFLSIAYYIEDLQSEKNLDREKHSWQLKVSADELQLLVAKDSIALCIKSRKEADPKSSFYCEHSKSLYAILVNKVPIPFYTQLLREEAFDAMIVDIDHRLRTLKYGDLVNEDPKEAEKLLNKYLSRRSLVVFGFALVISLLLFIAVFTHYGKNK